MKIKKINVHLTEQEIAEGIKTYINYIRSLDFARDDKEK